MFQVMFSVLCANISSFVRKIKVFLLYPLNKNMQYEFEDTLNWLSFFNFCYSTYQSKNMGLRSIY